MSNFREKITWLFTLTETEIRKVALEFCVVPAAPLLTICDRMIRFLHRRKVTVKYNGMLTTLLIPKMFSMTVLSET